MPSNEAELLDWCRVNRCNYKREWSQGKWYLEITRAHGVQVAFVTGTYLPRNPSRPTQESA